MTTQDDPVQVYKELSDWYDRRSEPPMRDRFLVLAADAALRNGRTDEAERLRIRLLKLSPYHLLKPYSSFTQAMQAPDVQTYIRDLRLNYPPEVALVLLNSLRTSGPKTDDTIPPPTPDASHDSEDVTVNLGDEPAEPLKVFSERHTDVTETAALPAEFAEIARRAAPPPSQPKTAPPAPRSAPPKSEPRQPPPPPKKKVVATPLPDMVPTVTATPIRPREPEAVGRGWFALGLCVLMGMAGFGFAVYIFARPFLPF
jgi:hypothetical protein